MKDKKLQEGKLLMDIRLTISVNFSNANIIEKLLKLFIRNSILNNVLNYLPKKYKDILERCTMEYKIDNVYSSGNDVKISVVLKEVNYNEVAHSVLPMVLDSFDETDFVHKLVNIIGNDKDAVIDSVLNSISDDKKTAIISLAVAEYNNKICRLLTKLMDKYKLKNIKANRITVEKTKEV